MLPDALRSRLHALAWAAGAVAAIVATLLLLAPTHDVGTVLAAFWRGSIGTTSALVSGTLVRVVPLTLLGVGLSIAFKAGVFNIGAEGQLLAGAAAATAVGLSLGALGGVSVVIALALSAVAGGAWAGVAALLRYRFGVLEVISTMMLNFVAANLVSYLVRGPLQEPSRAYPQSALIDAAARLPHLVPDSRLHVGIVLAIGACIAGSWFLSRTVLGFRVRAVGASPTAAAATGRINVAKVSAGALVASGALAGVAGGVEVTGVTYALYEHLTPGYGFAAIAVAILAGLRPSMVFGSALLFAALETGALGLQRDAGVPSVVATAIQAIVILAVIGAGSTKRLASLSAPVGAPA